MLYVNKITSHSTVDFAAEELKKYLRMMMPKVSDVKIAYAPDACDGFRLGLMKDFSLDTSDIKDMSLDDAVYIDTDEKGGVIAGSNERSVLFAVYEYLKRNGCRWLYPGIDGEYIPLKNIEPVSYRHVADMRFRGPCIEGAINQKMLLDYVDYMPKVGLNLFSSQFFLPNFFFERYHGKMYNDVSDTLPKEKVTNDTVLQWKTAAEVELKKRGLLFRDIGHGWTATPFGFDISSAWAPIDDSMYTDEDYKYCAMRDGKRQLHNHTPMATQFCMSNPEARRIVVKFIADYAEAHPYVDFPHVTLGDATNNHCECPECLKARVSDFYVMLLNELDEELTARGLDTRISFSLYHETFWAPLFERIKNPSRFSMQLAPISRTYTRTLSGEPFPEPIPYHRNHNPQITSLDACIPYVREWQKKTFSGELFVFEYHFWRHQHLELSHVYLAKRIFEDIEAYRSLGFNGMLQCGSLRSFFPNGFAYYLYARKLFDTSLTYEEIVEDYFSHAYGDAWREVYKYLEEIYDCFGFAFLEGEESKDEEISPYYNPERADKLKGVRALCQKGTALAKSLYGTAVRPEMVSAKLLAYHAEYCTLLADVLIHKANGDEDASIALYDETVRPYMSAAEPFLEPYHDFYQAFQRIHWLLEERGSKSLKIT